MRLGLHVPNFTWPNGKAALGAELAGIARHAEGAGFSSFSVMDHFFQIRNIGLVNDNMLECYTTLGYIAAVTKTIKLGAIVTGVTYRHPGVLIKEVTTLDVLSGGRAYLGIGAAWNEQEHEALGVPFPPLKERFERLEETLQIAHLMWQDGGDYEASKPFESRHYHLAHTLNVPQAMSRPHPPIMIGGTGEQKTLRFVAQYGDACNLFAFLGNDVLQSKLDILRGHCEALGRPYAEIDKTSLNPIHVTRDGANGTFSPQRAIDSFGALAELGFDEAICNLRNVSEPEALDIWRDEIISVVAKITPKGR